MLMPSSALASASAVPKRHSAISSSKFFLVCAIIVYSEQYLYLAIIICQSNLA